MPLKGGITNPKILADVIFRCCLTFKVSFPSHFIFLPSLLSKFASHAE